MLEYQAVNTKNTYSCIIPAFNENPRVLGVINAIVNVPEVTEIVCIDDGSIDDTYNSVREKFPNITLVHHGTNLGKTAAIRSGMKLASEEGILLIDGDLINVDHKEISQAIRVFEKNRLDSLLLCAKPVDSVDLLFRIFPRLSHCVTGNRIIRKEDLSKALDSPNLKNYQLEIAQNKYLMDNDMKVGYINISALNIYKSNKTGLRMGIKQEIFMWKQVLEYDGMLFNIRMAILFARKKYK